jgi:vacuolar protein sorting-associated protein VTA1
MADQIPAKLKSIPLASFAKRATQLERFKPIVTYWREYRLVMLIGDQAC